MTETYHMLPSEAKAARRDQALARTKALQATLPQDALGPTHGYVRALARAEALLRALRRQNETST